MNLETVCIEGMWSACLPEVVDSLSLRSRAYQVLYALGETSSTVRTLTDGEASCLVGIVQGMEKDGYSHSRLDTYLFTHMSASMRQYVATGSLAAQPQIDAESAATPRV